MATLFYYTGLFVWLSVAISLLCVFYKAVVKPTHKILIKKAWYFGLIDSLMFPINLYKARKLPTESAKIMVEHFRWRNIWTHRILKRILEKIANE